MTAGICFDSMPGGVDWIHVTRVPPRKYAHRQVAILSITDVFEPALLEEVRSSWERTLGPFVPDLPDVALSPCGDESPAR